MFFLSYAGTDAAIAGALAKGLKAAGVDIWFDKGHQAIEPGKPFTEQLERKLQESQAFLLLVPRHGVDRWVRAEVDVVLTRQVNDSAYPIIPLLPPGVSVRQLPPFIARFHALTLEGDITQWGRRQFQGLAEQLGTASTRFVLSPNESPFPGLESFKEEQAHFYFGRDQEIREALARLGQDEGTYRRWLTVEGASGAGKSSFARAGLVPSIRGGWVEGAPSRWRIAVMRPGKNPIHQLARALVRVFDWQDEPEKLNRVKEALLRSTSELRDIILGKLEEGEGFLLVLDQLEEVFTLTEGARDEPRHLDMLLKEALTGGELPFFLITTLRSDFLIRMGELPHLEKALNEKWTARYALSLMKPEQLKEAILGPTQLAGLTWEGGLQERILQEAQVLSGGLPLAAHVLCELWKRRSGHTLTHAAYEELGRVAGALTHSADALLDTFTAEEKAHVRRLMLALVKVGQGTRDVRRTRTIDEAIAAAGGGGTGRGILARLSGGRDPQKPAETPAPPRLLAVGTEHVDLIHEALLEQWQTLRNWLRESRQALERQNDLDAAARLWKATGALPSEAQLQYLRSAEPISTEAWELLEQVKRADLAQSLVARTLEEPVQEDPQLCLRLIIEAHQLHPSGQTTDALWSWHQRRQRLSLRGHSDSVRAIAFSPDGQRILTGSDDKTVRLWNATTGKALAELRGHSGSVTVAAFSPNGQRVLTASNDDETARLWDATSGKALAELRGHSGSVTTAAFIPDGQRILTVDSYGAVRLWDATSGKALAELRGDAGPMIAVTFSPDGQRVLAARGDNTVRLWDATTGKVLAELRGHTGIVTVIAISPDGQRVLTAGNGETARLWDATSGKALAELRGDVGPMIAVTFSPDGQRVLAARGDNTVRLWDATTGKVLAELRGHTGIVMVIAISPDGQRVLTAGNDETARLWDATTGKALLVLREPSDLVGEAIFSPDGQCVLTLAGRIGRLWNATTGKALAELRGHSRYVTVSAFSPDGKRVLTAGQDGTARLWDATTGKALVVLRGHSSQVWGATFSPDGQCVLTFGEDETIRLWDATSGKALAELHGHSGQVWGATFSPDGQCVLTFGEDETIRLWDATSGKALVVLRGHSGPVRAAAFSPDGQRVLTAGEDGTARLWGAITGKAQAELHGHSGPILAGGFSPDGQRVLTFGEGETIRLWDATSGKALAELHGHSGQVWGATFSPDGQCVLTFGEDETIRLWDATSGKALVVLRGHSGPVRAAAFSPDGQRVLTAGEDETARLWDATSGKALVVLRGHSDSVRDVAFSPDGQRILTASRDETARLWDATTGKTLAELSGHSGPVTVAEFSPNGQYVLTASEDGTARLWRLHDVCPSTEELFERARALLFRELTEKERELYLGAALP